MTKQNETDSVWESLETEADSETFSVPNVYSRPVPGLFSGTNSIPVLLIP